MACAGDGIKLAFTLSTPYWLDAEIRGCANK